MSAPDAPAPAAPRPAPNFDSKLAIRLDAKVHVALDMDTVAALQFIASYNHQDLVRHLTTMVAKSEMESHAAGLYKLLQLARSEFDTHLSTVRETVERANKKDPS